MIIDDMMRDEYDVYLSEHIRNVRVGFEWLLMNMPELFKNYDADYLGQLILSHDSSKYSGEEYDAYCNYFYGHKRQEAQDEFDRAWLHHQHSNPHHWQHWLLREDDGSIKALEMPYEYILEMIADWWSFSWKSENLYEIFNWYNKNKSTMVLHDATRETCENILSKLRDKLDEIHDSRSDTTTPSKS